MKRALQSLAALLSVAGSALANSSPLINNPIYIITNAETPSLFRPGLSPIGFQRATQCLPQLFQTLDIGKIIMCPRNDDSAVCFETLATTQPTADALGLPIDTSCGADENTDDNCVTNLAKKFAKTSTQAILIVWASHIPHPPLRFVIINCPNIQDFDEIGALLESALDLDTDPADAIDGIHFDIFTVVIKGKIKQVTSQNCTDIDGVAPGTATRRAIASTEELWTEEEVERENVSRRRTAKSKRSFW
ncbi:hypothetical protein JR316_0012881 [Psilocybe cubensis]|uniref:Uncharacterized protein n=2 Tax=Psilocybe cubensis TaxID=181762 RepID=A0A8H7XTI4_PSICU|nr:hypothetical protein JR316_0012881 [Psilocybe cubensis]KAH9474422.1 hypothetical protein JR316_0012881 [Psilocybe cubensis]